MLGPQQAAELVAVDVDGVLWLLERGSRRDLVRWCLLRQVRVFVGPGALIEALRAGQVVGLLPSEVEAHRLPEWRAGA